MEETVLSGRVSRSRAWRICSAVIAGGRPRRARGCGRRPVPRGALDDELADELRQRGEDVEDQPAAGGGGVQGLVQALEPDTMPAQRADDLDQVGQRPGQPVQARHDQGVAGPQVVQAGGQLGPVGVLARQLVSEDAEAARLGQGVLLAVEQLAGGADPRVADRAPVRTAGSGARRLPGASGVSG